MTLSNGTMLSHHEISSLLGKGGMGEVYRAKDQKLGRDVAIKVLPEEFAKDADRIARFQREAKLLASLNHSNIASIYGLEESDGTHFLVLELIEGDTLADRLKRGAIPVEDALKLALQIAEALEAAHEKGVIHRDLKPANIKVTPDGKVKVLDFGLAKAFAGDQAEVNLSHSPTLSEAATLQGVILGTAAYMSPEQARGKPVDKRTDIWAFGCVLYEMLTGKAAFQGEDVTDILAAVVKSGVNLDLLPANIHPRIREVIIRCLQKEQRKRYGGIGEAQYEIEQALADPSGVFAQPVTAAKSRKKLRLGIPWVAAIAIFGIIIAGMAVWKLKPSDLRQVMRVEYNLPEGQHFSNVREESKAVAISPDGNLLTYATPEGLYLRRMGDWTAKLFAETEGALYPFFSPDSQWIGYVSNRELKKVAIDGDAPVTLCEADVDGGFSWTSDNRILQGRLNSVRWVSADGGRLEPLFEENETPLGVPQMLPDAKSVLFTTGSARPQKIMLRSLESGESKELFEGAFAQYIKTGHIVYGVGNNLYARSFDLDTLEVTGGPVFLVEGVRSGSWIWDYAVSDSGTLVYIPAITAGMDKQTLAWVDREGKEEPIANAPDDYRTLKISPDGTQIAVGIHAGDNQNIHIGDIDRGNMRKLTFDESDDECPLWTPDGKSIVFASYRAEGVGLFSKSADGTGEVKAISSLLGSPIMPCSWSANGKTLLLNIGTGYAIQMLYMEGSEGITPLLEEKHSVFYPRISPDGQWIAYQSDETGDGEIYVRPFPEVNKGRWQVSANGGTSPLWSRNGRELFYWTDDALMVVPVETAPTFIYGAPKVQFQRMPVFTGFFRLSGITWDIHPDGKRFLMMKRAEVEGEEDASSVPRKINIVLNWFEELKDRVPTD
jgi:serine/threonine-protein kinase